MTPAVPMELRRGLHRSVTADNNLATLRSHSQPPANMRQVPASRVLPVAAYNSPVPGQPLGFPSLHQYQQAYLQARRTDVQYASSAHNESPQFGSGRLDPGNEERISRQYVGYFVAQSPYRPHDGGGLSPSNSSHADTGYGNRGVSPNLSRLRSHMSRSPSPSKSNVSRDRSISFYSAASAPSSSRPGRGNSNGQPWSSGPVIVDGSSDALDWASPPDSTFFQPSTSDATSLSDDLPVDTPGTTTETAPSYEPLEAIVLDPRAETRATTSSPNVLQFGEFPATATIRRKRQSRSDELETPERTSPVSSRTEPKDETPNGLGINFSAQKPSEPPPAIPAPPLLQAPPSSTVAGLNLASSFKPVPFLSPVREVRTPSPTATRNNTGSLVEHQNKHPHGRSISLSGKDKMITSPLAESSTLKGSEKSMGTWPSILRSNGVQTAAQGEKSPQSQGQPQAFAQSQGPSLPHLQTSSWQQSTGKKKKKGQKAGSMSGPPLPRDEGDMKGG